MRSLGVLLVLIGCQPADESSVDAPGDTVPPDGSSTERGVLLSWGAQPSLPGALNDRISVSEATFNIMHLQIVGDAGDSRTTRSRYSISWSAEGRPEREEFNDAPVGRYSKITIDMRATPGVAYTYTIDGTWTDDDDDDDEGEVRRFRIQDPLPVTITVDCDRTLAAGGAAMVSIRLALLDALNGVDFRRLDPEDGVYLLRIPNPQLTQFRERLTRAFMLGE
jgi:hypothetical protein